MAGKYDMSIQAKLEALEIDSKTKAETRKKVSEALKSIDLRLDTKALEKELSKVAQQFGQAMSFVIKDTIKKTAQSYHFTNTGQRVSSSALKGSSANVSAGYRSPDFQGTLSPSGRQGNTAVYADKAILNEVVEFAKEMGATKKALKKLQSNFAAAVSGLEFNESTGKWEASFELGKGRSAILGGGFERTSRGYELGNAAIQKLEYSATQAGSKSYKQSMSALRDIKDVDKLIAAYKKLLELKKEDASITKEIEKLEKLRVKLDKDSNKVKRGGTDTQKQSVKETKKRIEYKQKEQEINDKIKAQQKEQDKVYKDSEDILKQINALKKQSISNEGKQNSEELNKLNSDQIRLLEEQLKKNEQILSVEQKQKLVAEQKNYEAQQNILKQEKALKLRSSRNQAGTFMDEVETAFSRVTTYGVAYGTINAFKNSLKTVVETVINFDKLMTNLRIVTQGTAEETKKLAQSYIDLAAAVGTTSTKVFEAADLWLRQGRSVAETNSLIEATMVMANVAQIDSAKAADILTSALNGFKLEAKDAMHIVDMFAAVDLAAAANTEELAEAMQRVAATAGEVGISIENVTSYIATLVDATRLDSGTIKISVA